MCNYDKLVRVAIYFEIAKNSLVIIVMILLIALMISVGVPLD